MVSKRIFGRSALVAVIGLVIVSCNRGLGSSTSQPLPTTKTQQTTQSHATPAVYSGTAQFGPADKGRTVTVVVDTEIDVSYRTAVSVANEDQDSIAVMWIGFRPGLNHALQGNGRRARTDRSDRQLSRDELSAV